MNWLVLYEIVYIVIVICVCLRIIYEARNNSKTLAYLLLVIFFPIAGIFFYFSFGINYRKRKMYSKKLFKDENLAKKLKKDIFQYSKLTFEKGNPALAGNKELAYMLTKNSMSALTASNAVKLLING